MYRDSLRWWHCVVRSHFVFAQNKFSNTIFSIPDMASDGIISIDRAGDNGPIVSIRKEM